MQNSHHERFCTRVEAQVDHFQPNLDSSHHAMHTRHVLHGEDQLAFVRGPGLRMDVDVLARELRNTSVSAFYSYLLVLQFFPYMVLSFRDGCDVNQKKLRQEGGPM